jgi:hypothetical protein
VIVVAVVAFALISGSGDDDEASTDDTASGGTGSEQVELPDGVMPFSVAEAEGTVDDIDWGERCDVEARPVRLPELLRRRVLRPFEGDNGGRPRPASPRRPSRSCST